MKRPATGSGDSAIRDAYRRSTGGRPTGECPSSDELAGLALGEIEPAARARLTAHVAECSDCALELAAARAVATSDDSVSLIAALPSTRRPAPRPGSVRRSWPVLLAAGLALFAIGGLTLWRSGQASLPSTDPVRSAAPAPAAGARAASAVVPAPGAVLPISPARLAWLPQVGATDYRAHLLDAAGRELWRSEWTANASIDLPRDLPVVAGSFFWRVEVRGPVQRSRLGPYRFSVGPRPVEDAG